MYQLNEKIRNLKPYDPISGEYAVRLDANESFFGLPEDLRQEFAHIASELVLNRYPDPLSTEVCKAFADYYQVPVENVTAGNGSDELISIICNSFLEKGDAFLTLEPDFSMYRFYGVIAEGVPVTLQKPENLRIDVDEVIRVCRDKDIKLLIFSNPCNPTSLGLGREEVRRLITSIDALVVLDEAYMDFWDQSLLPEFDQYDNLLILRTCSKAFGGAALRLGFAVGALPLTNALKAVKSPYNLNSFTQAAGAALLRRKEESKAALAEILLSKKELLDGVKTLAERFPGEMEVFESDTNFVFIRTGKYEEIFRYMLEKGIAIRKFAGYLRITAGTREENRAVLDALQEFFIR